MYKRQIKYRAREDGEEAKGMVSRTLKSDMEKVYNHLKDKYGYCLLYTS